MSKRPPFQPADFSCQSSSDIIEKLRQPPMASQFSGTAMSLVMGIRLMASCVAARHDPLVELTRHLESVTAAKAIMDFARACADVWAENIMVSRPCCHALTPDEAVIAQMVQNARCGDRDGFARVLDGLIRRERHDGLYAITRETIAATASAS